MSETALELSRKAADVLAARGIEQSRLDAELLLAHALGISRLQLYLQHDRPVTEEELAHFRALVRRRLKREPVQYILGTAHFRTLELAVDPRVLIPRPETEVLVGHVLDWAWAQVGGRPGKAQRAQPLEWTSGGVDEGMNGEATPAAMLRDSGAATALPGDSGVAERATARGHAPHDPMAERAAHSDALAANASAHAGGEVELEDARRLDVAPEAAAAEEQRPVAREGAAAEEQRPVAPEGADAEDHRPLIHSSTPPLAPSGAWSLTALDLGTGSGAIALALLKEGPFGRVVATDASPEALAVARANAQRLGLAERLELRPGKLWEAVPKDERFDVVVSNPPYVAEPERAALAPEITDWEPAGALFAGAEGFDVLEPLARGAAEHLRPGGLLALEIGAAQAAGMQARLAAVGAFAQVRVARDLAGRDRVVLATV